MVVALLVNQEFTVLVWELTEELKWSEESRPALHCSTTAPKQQAPVNMESTKLAKNSARLHNSTSEDSTCVATRGLWASALLSAPSAPTTSGDWGPCAASWTLSASALPKNVATTLASNTKCARNPTPGKKRPFGSWRKAILQIPVTLHWQTITIVEFGR